MYNINFVKTTTVRLTEQTQKDKKVFNYVLIATVGSLLIAAVVLGFNLILSNRAANLEKEIKQTSVEVTKQEPLEAEYLFFVNKLNIIKQLFEIRTEKQVAISYFTDLFGPEIEISGINYETEEGILSLNIASPHVFLLEEVFVTLDDPTVKNKFKTMNKHNLKRSLDGSYEFKLVVTFKEDSDLIHETDPI